MQVFGPLGKHEGKAVARLAAIYGCCASLQGSKSNRKLVVVSSHVAHLCLDEGACSELCRDALCWVRR